MPIHKNIPARDHIKKLESLLTEIREDYFINVKDGCRLRSELTTLDHKTKENCNDLIKTVLNDLYVFRDQFIQMRETDRSETEFLKQQTQALISDRIKLEHELAVAESRINALETDVGIDYNDMIN